MDRVQQVPTSVGTRMYRNLLYDLLYDCIMPLSAISSSGIDRHMRTSRPTVYGHIPNQCGVRFIAIK